MAPSNGEGATGGGTPKNWLHQDSEILGPGVTYTVKYIGCLEVLTSMKSLDFETRTLIAKECIIRICETAGLRSVDRRRKQDRRLQRILADKPVMDHAGANVSLRISASSLVLTEIETATAVASHAMPNISFASGGDQDTMDFVAYVGKDDRHNRACFVLECEGALAQNVIATIGQAFELRFREFMRRSPIAQIEALPKDPDYYNDLPGKLPPEPPKISKPKENKSTKPKETGPDNLIEFDSQVDAVDPMNMLVHDYVNTNLDPFDMMPMSEVLPVILKDPIPSEHVSAIEQKLQTEPWYHGPISRSESEDLLSKDGDFLVRESKGQRGQFVLTGLQGGAGKHLLLIDPDGIVRTKERTFDSVSHLINFHRDNQLPIISADSALLLVNPICRES